MGYNTDFSGRIKITPSPSPEIKKLVNGLANSRRMKRDPEKLKTMGFDGNYGAEGEFFYNPESDYYGQERDVSVTDYNTPPKDQPGLWLQWIIRGDYIEWSEWEKFYNYIEWMEYLIERIFAPEGYVLNGSIQYRGEDFDDFGTIYVKDNTVTKIPGDF